MPLEHGIAKTADPDPMGSASETSYFFDGYRIIEEQDALPTPTTLATYVYGNYIDEALTMDRGGQPYYYHQNALWSVEALTNSSAVVVERTTYDAYGYPKISDGLGNVQTNPWGSTPHSAIGNPYLFTGRQWDEETGLYYYRARHYAPMRGRFLQRDPIGYQYATNLYFYALDNPLRFLDPSGRNLASELTAEVAVDAACAACLAALIFTPETLGISCVAAIIYCSICSAAVLPILYEIDNEAYLPDIHGKPLISENNVPVRVISPELKPPTPEPEPEPLPNTGNTFAAPWGLTNENNLPESAISPSLPPPPPQRPVLLPARGRP